MAIYVVSYVAVWLVLCLLIASLYLFPRTIAGAALTAMLLQNTSLLLRLCRLSINQSVILITFVFFVCFVPGLALDIAQIRGRWTSTIRALRACW